MSVEEIEAQALKLAPKARARLAGKLLESLEDLSDEENEQLWAEEAERRDAELDTQTERNHSAAKVFSDVRNQLE